jgi:hypothetical protein
MQPSLHSCSAGFMPAPFHSPSRCPHAVIACGSWVCSSRFSGAPGSQLVHEPGSWVLFSCLGLLLFSETYHLKLTTYDFSPSLGAPHAVFACPPSLWRACGSWFCSCGAGFHASAFGVRRLAAAFAVSTHAPNLSSRPEWPVLSSAPLFGAPATQGRDLLLAFLFSIFHFLFSSPPSRVGAFSLYTTN